jgi:glucan phosphoethanolaminetransferase (alkaline phosphatase superfamily)
MKTKLSLSLLILLLLLPSLFHTQNLLQSKGAFIVIIYTLFSALLLLLPLVFIRPRIYVYLMLPFLFLMPFELIHVTNYDGYTTLAAFVSSLGSNPGETGEFLLNYRHYLYVLGPLIVLCIFSLIFFFDKEYRLKPYAKAGILLLFVAVTSAFTVKTAYELHKREEAIFGKGLKELYTRLTHQNYPFSYLAKGYQFIKQHNALQAAQLIKKDFVFGATGDSQLLAKNPVVVLVIGETSRAQNWQLGGYQRETNPELINRQGLVYFKNTISVATHTSQTIQLVLSRATPTDMSAVYSEKSILTAFNEAGYKTIWLSNQNMTGGVETAVFAIAREADETIFTGADYNVNPEFDDVLVPALEKVLQDNTDTPLFIIVHTMGSHEIYRQRYPEEFDRFKPSSKGDDYNFSSPGMRERLLNSYDNSILYTDYILDRLIQTVEDAHRLSTLTYFSDHGENLLDHDSERFGHGGVIPTLYVTDVPMFIWSSPEFQAQQPDKVRNISENSNQPASNLYLFDTLLDINNIKLSGYTNTNSLAAENFNPSERYILNTSYEPLKYSDIKEKLNKTN